MKTTKSKAARISVPVSAPPPTPARVRRFPLAMSNSTTTYAFSDVAYTKLVLHALKHPHAAVNGVLLGRPASTARTVDVVDAIPLQHHWVTLSPAMEMGLEQARSHAASLGLVLVGFYQASDRVSDTTLSLVGERVASKLKEAFSDAVAVVIGGSRLSVQSGKEHALVPYTAPLNAPFRPVMPSCLSITSDIPARALKLVRAGAVHEQFADFDDYLETNPKADWLRNSVVEEALRQ
ncbi:UPF0172-domain-containing protein [Artomyces pyxidatus]|uniref:UPF0172-domain-containing protein n=1 Tax=Artomyces pyxidatus TaxID=48021 RepID=A0ACB8T8T0_9AGAM|nr:UPF0172-domain-containing protein [Artomyces pyxidatus]